jgi:hypothetical protein
MVKVIALKRWFEDGPSRRDRLRAPKNEQDLAARIGWLSRFIVLSRVRAPRYIAGMRYRTSARCTRYGTI